MKNNKVLITLGCSFTEGVGCYDYTEISEKQLQVYKKTTYDKEFYTKNLDNFLYGSWGSQLQEMLGASTFYNIGMGGDSNSGQSKKLYDYMDLLDLKDKDVMVVWLMTYPQRFSFYKNGIPRTVGFDVLDSDTPAGKMVDGYIKHIEEDYDFNTICEQYYYLRTVAELCKNRNFKFGWTSVEHETSLKVLSPLLDSYLSKTLLKNQIHGYSFIQDLLNRDNHEEKMSLICGHPNKIGYKEVATRFFSALVDMYPSFVRYKLEEKYNKDSITYEKIPLNREEYSIRDYRLLNLDEIAEHNKLV